MAHAVPDQTLIDSLNALVAARGSQTKAAEKLGIPRTTLQGHLAEARKRGLTGTETPADETAALQYRIKTLETELTQARDDQLTVAMVRREILKLRDAASVATPPVWVSERKKGGGKNPLTPMTIWSDWHWGEVVNKAQVNGVNEYNLEIAHRRAQRLLDGTLNLAFNYTVHGEYPGIVLMLGGDMVSGTIHDELVATNDKPIMPVVVDLFGVLKRGILALKEQFGRVYVPCVVGNHGRTTVRPVYKNAAYTSYDWLIYSLLERDFQDDDAVVFQVPEGSDVHFNVWRHRFMLTHGDKLGVMGGDGIIGALGPICRGSFKTRNSSASIGLDFDTLVIGHWHQYIPLPRVVVNGCLKGFDEYAKDRLRAVPERPQQALWFVHPENGIVSQMAVYADERESGEERAWLSWAA